MPITLTPRQAEFLALSAQGLRHADIAATCYVSLATVSTTLEDARVRLSANTLVHAVAIAVALELLTLDSDGLASPSVAA